jgi:hypothetical protein
LRTTGGADADNRFLTRIARKWFQSTLPRGSDLPPSPLPPGGGAGFNLRCHGESDTCDPILDTILEEKNGWERGAGADHHCRRDQEGHGRAHGGRQDSLGHPDGVRDHGGVLPGAKSRGHQIKRRRSILLSFIKEVKKIFFFKFLYQLLFYKFHV